MIIYSKINSAIFHFNPFLLKHVNYTAKDEGNIFSFSLNVLQLQFINMLTFQNDFLSSSPKC